MLMFPGKTSSICCWKLVGKLKRFLEASCCGAFTVTKSFSAGNYHFIGFLGHIFTESESRLLFTFI